MLLLIVLASVGSLIVLMILASRYSGMLENVVEKRESAQAEKGKAELIPDLPVASAGASVTTAMTRLDEYIRIRQVLGAAIDAEAISDPGQLTDAAAERLMASREAALATSEMDATEYLQMRGFYRQWKAGGAGLSPNLAAAFEYRREMLVVIDLEPYESYGF
jgi:hypothetical protein